MAGSVGRCEGALRLRFIFVKPEVGEESERNHDQDGVMMQSKPRTSLEVIKAEFFLHLLMSLFAGPAGLHGGDNGAHRGRSRKAAQIIPAITIGKALTDEPGLITRQMHAHRSFDTVCRANA